MDANRTETADGQARAVTLWREAAALFDAAGAKATEAEALDSVGYALARATQLDSARVALAQALAISTALHDSVGVGTALNGLGNVAGDAGQLDSALALYDQALRLRLAGQDRIGQAATLQNIGNVHLDRGRPDSALGYYRQALDIERDIGNQPREEGTRIAIARGHAAQSQFDSASIYFRSAADLARAAGHRRNQLGAWAGLAQMYHQRREADSAVSSWRRALAIASQLGDRRLEAEVLNAIGWAYFDVQHEQDSALHYYKQALAVQRAVRDDRGAGVTLNNLGWLYHAGHADSAAAYYRDALRAERVAGDRSMEAKSLTNMLNLFGAQGQFDSALGYARSLAAADRALHDRPAEARALLIVAQIYQHIGQPDSAQSYFQRAHEVMPLEMAGGRAAATGAQPAPATATVQREVFADHPAISVVSAILRAKRDGHEGVLIIGSGPDASTSCFVPDGGAASCTPLPLKDVLRAQLLPSIDAADAPLMVQGLWGEPAVALLDASGNHVAWRYDAKFAAMGHVALITQNGPELVLAERNKGLLFLDAKTGKVHRTVQLPPLGDLFAVVGSDGHPYLMGLSGAGHVVVLTTAGEFVRASQPLGAFHAAANPGNDPTLFIAPRDTLYTIDERLQTAGGWYAPGSADLHIEAVDRSEGRNGVLVALFIGAGPTRGRTGLYAFGPERQQLLAETSLQPSSGLLLLSESEHSVTFLVGDLGRTWRYTVGW